MSAADWTMESFFSEIKSKFVTPAQLVLLYNFVPTRYILYPPQLIFTTDVDGYNLGTLYSKVQDIEPTFIFIRTTRDEVFGAYCSNKWTERNISGTRYFGSGEMFIFTLRPKCTVYPWVGENRKEADPATKHTTSLFMTADSEGVAIGGGGNGPAIYIGEEMKHGRTASCHTFGNAPLCATEDFVCQMVEVFRLFI